MCKSVDALWVLSSPVAIPRRIAIEYVRRIRRRVTMASHMHDGRRGQGFWRPGSEKPGAALSQRVSLDVDQEVGGEGEGGGAIAGLMLSFPG